MTDLKSPVPTAEDNASIPADGNLGLLAYGYRGIMLWRAERQRRAELTTKRQTATTSQPAHEKK